MKKIQSNIVFGFLNVYFLLAQSPERPFVAGAPPGQEENLMLEILELLALITVYSHNLGPKLILKYLFGR